MIASADKVVRRDDVIGGIRLKSPEDDEAIAGRFNLVVEYPESMAEAERSDLVLDQPLARLRQRALRLADADGERAALGLAGFDKQLREEVRFARAAASENALVPAGLQQRLKDFRCRNFQDGQ